MKILQIKKSTMQTIDITQVMTAFKWSGSVSQAARTLELSVLHAPYDENIKALDLRLSIGDFIILQEEKEKKEIFFGEIQTIEKQSENGELTYYCIDLLNHLLKSNVVYNFKNTTAEHITKKVCADFELKTGEIIQTNVTISKMIVENSSVYDVIMSAYTKAAKQTNKQYVCRMNRDKLSVVEKGKVVENFVLSEEYNITSSSYQETIDNMVNTIKIYDDKNKQIGQVTNEEWIKNFGVYQQIYKKEKGMNEIQAANTMLSGIEKTVSVECVNASLECIAGNAVEVYDSATGLKGLFYIDQDSHTWQNGVHTTSLELNFENLMDSKEEEGE